MEEKYEYLINLLEEYLAAPSDMDCDCFVKVLRSTNRSSQAQMFLADVKSGNIMIPVATLRDWADRLDMDAEDLNYHIYVQDDIEALLKPKMSRKSIR